MEKQKCPQVRFKGFTDVWNQFKLGELCSEFRSGEFIKAENIVALGKYPVYGGNGLRGYTDTYNHNGEFALIGRQGALCGNMQLSCGKAFFTEHAVAVKANNSNETRFLYYLFGIMNLGQYSGQSAQPGLAVGNLIEIETLVPDKTEQSQIGEFFQNLDQSIALHEKKLAQTQNFKKAMLEKMFPKHGSKRPEIRLKGFSGDWDQHELGQHSEMFNGDRGVNYPSSDDMVKVGIPFINAGDLEDGRVNLQNANKITRYKYNQLNGAKIKFGDIVYCLRGTLGKNAFIDNFNEGTVASSLVVIRPKNILGAYLFQVLNTDIEFRQRTLCDEGAAQPNLSAKNLAGFMIPVPSIEEQKAIGCFFNKLDETLNLQQQQLQTLKNLKQAFLEKMFV